MADFEPYTPRIENPYPASWQSVSDFEFTDHLYMARAKEALQSAEGREAEYLVYSEYRCQCVVDGQPWKIVVPSGMLTDLTSVPWAARSLVGRVGPQLEAAIVHDFLFIAWQDIDGGEPRKRDFEFANEVMLQAMIAAGVGYLKRNTIYAAVSTWIARGTYDEPNPGTRYVRVPRPMEPSETAALIRSTLAA